MAYEAPNYGGYERARRDVNFKYSNDAATNEYGRFISQQRGSRQLGDMSRDFGRSFPGFKSQFGARGLSGGGIKSGAMERSMGNYLGDYARNFQRTQQDIAQDLGQYDLNQDRLTSWRDRSLADIEAQKANDIANSAQSIMYLRQMLGGL